MNNFLLSFIPLAWVHAIEIIFFGTIITFALYYFVGWFFWKTGLEKIIFKFFGHTTHIGQDKFPKVISKYLASFVFLIFLRNAVKVAGYSEVEEFLSSVVAYFPHLLLALLITFFGIQSSRTIYSLVFNAISFENPRTAYVLANVGRVVVLFFTFTIVINQVNTGDVQIIPEYLVRSVLIGFVSAASLAFALAFGLGGRKFAEDFIREYIDKDDTKDTESKK